MQPTLLDWVCQETKWKYTFPHTTDLCREMWLLVTTPVTWQSASRCSELHAHSLKWPQRNICQAWLLALLSSPSTLCIWEFSRTKSVCVCVWERQIWVFWVWKLQTIKWEMHVIQREGHLLCAAAVHTCVLQIAGMIFLYTKRKYLFNMLHYTPMILKVNCFVFYSSRFSSWNLFLFLSFTVDPSIQYQLDVFLL